MNAVKKNKSRQDGSYKNSRMNAVKHGLLAKVTVLPWEDQTELDNIRKKFTDSFTPQEGMEQYLVEELAIIAFRKNRLYKAENACIAFNAGNVKWLGSLDTRNHVGGLNILTESGELKMQADIFTDPVVSLRSLMYQDEGISKSLETYQKEFNSVVGLVYVILTVEEATYELCLEKLENQQKQLFMEWKTAVSNPKDDFKADKQSLLKWLSEMGQNLENMINIIKVKDTAKEYIKGVGNVPCDKMMNVQRYECHLDRAFDRKLTQLLNLIDKRSSYAQTIDA